MVRKRQSNKKQKKSRKIKYRDLLIYQKKKNTYLCKMDLGGQNKIKWKYKKIESNTKN